MRIPHIRHSSSTPARTSREYPDIRNLGNAGRNFFPEWFRTKSSDCWPSARDNSEEKYAFVCTTGTSVFFRFSGSVGHESKASYVEAPASLRNSGSGGAVVPASKASHVRCAGGVTTGSSRSIHVSASTVESTIDSLVVLSSSTGGFCSPGSQVSNIGALKSPFGSATIGATVAKEPLTFVVASSKN